MLVLPCDSLNLTVSGVKLWTVTGHSSGERKFSLALQQLDCVECKMHRVHLSCWKTNCYERREHLTFVLRVRYPGNTVHWLSLPCLTRTTPIFWATVCKTVRPMLSDRCLSVCLNCPVCPVCNVGVLWENGWMRQDETWLAGRPRPWPHCVRWGPISPTPKGAHPPIFDPYLLWPNGWMD